MTNLDKCQQLCRRRLEKKAEFFRVIFQTVTQGPRYELAEMLRLIIILHSCSMKREEDSGVGFTGDAMEESCASLLRKKV